MLLKLMEKETQINVSVKVPIGTTECSPSLWLSVSLLELLIAQQPSETVQKSIVCLPLSLCYAKANSTERDEFSALKAGLRKVKNFTDYVSAVRAKKASCEEEGSDGRCSDKSMDPECNYPFYTDSLNNDEWQSEETKDDYSINGQNDFWIYYSTSKLDVGCCNIGNSRALISEQILRPNLKHIILSWKKRKLSFRIHKAKGETFLKKNVTEKRVERIFYDCRQLSSSDESSSGLLENVLVQMGHQYLSLRAHVQLWLQSLLIGCIPTKMSSPSSLNLTG
ncbi:uncharacterized protein LOC121241284 [Juglans microcarpa x Juglans regia]|uniref:uncharacterized protein LOC121241284 n=1 Tax=Juglans microcarpa x Juglans regia TaxID=2249226 RepID=UPI001B7EADFC|nr:uncharacterized protein LOC121241284 [Juglans microcarpa x Juglans regia]